MKVALICPADFTVFLCCKWIIKHIQDKGNEVVVVSPLGKDKFYLQEIKKFNVKHIEIRMNRHINLFDDVSYIFDLIKIFKNEKINSVFAVCTKPNIFAPIAAKISGINDIFISIWGRGTAFLSRSGIKSLVIKFILIFLYKLSFLLSKKIWFTNPNDLDYFVKNNLLDEDKLS